MNIGIANLRMKFLSCSYFFCASLFPPFGVVLVFFVSAGQNESAGTVVYLYFVRGISKPTEQIKITEPAPLSV
jgi:hypothetical protein